MACRMEAGRGRNGEGLDDMDAVVPAGAAGTAGLLIAFVMAPDPFGLRVGAGQSARPIMDINQRYMYPQLVRSGRFDVAVLGTSTMRLLDPDTLSRGLDACFVNLAMNAATPWSRPEWRGWCAAISGRRSASSGPRRDPGARRMRPTPPNA